MGRLLEAFGQGKNEEGALCHTGRITIAIPRSESERESPAKRNAVTSEPVSRVSGATANPGRARRVHRTGEPDSGDDASSFMTTWPRCSSLVSLGCLV